MDTVTLLVLVATSYVLAGFVKGVIGMGLPTVAIGLLGLFMTPPQAAAILVLPSLITNIWQCMVGGHFIELVKRLWPLLLGVCVGIFAGAVWVGQADARVATLWLGGALAAYGVIGLTKVNVAVPPELEKIIGFPAGVFSGLISVQTGVFVIPAVIFIQALGMDRNRLVQSLGIFFVVATTALGGALAHAGEIKTSLLLPALIGLGTAIVGMWLGQIVRGMISAATFRLSFFIGILGLGVHLIVRSL